MTDREYRTVTNIWGDDTPIDLREIDTDQLWAMQDRVTDAVQLSFEDDDKELLGILMPLEGEELFRRFTRGSVSHTPSLRKRPTQLVSSKTVGDRFRLGAQVRTQLVPPHQLS
jgi:hypothetical protein